MNSQELDELCIQTVRFLSAEGVQAAKSGHPGMPMGMAAAAYALWTNHLKHNPANPAWRFSNAPIFSGGDPPQHGFPAQPGISFLPERYQLQDLLFFHPSLDGPQYRLGLAQFAGPCCRHRVRASLPAQFAARDPGRWKARLRGDTS